MMNEEELILLSQAIQMCNVVCSVWNKYNGDKQAILYLLQIRDDLTLKRNELYEEQNKNSSDSNSE